MHRIDKIEDETGHHWRQGQRPVSFCALGFEGKLTKRYRLLLTRVRRRVVIDRNGTFKISDLRNLGHHKMKHVHNTPFALPTYRVPDEDLQAVSGRFT